jgi:hypothetical protein
MWGRKLLNLMRVPSWHVETESEPTTYTQDTVIKAIINPSSPFIALPLNLFKLISEEWLTSFSDLKPFCGDNFCLVMSPCSEVPYLSDFGIKLGSLNDTNQDSQDDDEMYNILYRGKSEVERHKAKPMFFKIPFESYLINGEDIGLERNVCYLSITGFIPNNLRVAVLGQPFIQNYLTVLNMESMEIGLGAHIGTDAAIQRNSFN